MKKRHIAVWLVLALLLLALWVWQAVQEESVSSTRTAITATSAPATPNGDLRIDAWAGDARLVSGNHLPLLISIENPTNNAVWVHFARFQHPGFVLAPKKPNTPLPLKIEKGESVTFTFDLVAGEEPGRYAIGAVIAWGIDETHLIRRKPISLRPIAINSHVTGALLLFLRAFQSFVKDLALPLALAFLGFWLKKQEEVRAAQREKDEKNRESERQRADEARLEQRKAAAEKNAQTQQTWNLLLLKSHQNAERHYMPLSKAAERVGYYWKKFSAAADDTERDKQIDLCFYSFLLFLSRMRRLGRLIGGFYFKSRGGEDVGARAWILITDWCDETKNFTRDLRESAAAALSHDATYPEYLADAAKNTDVIALKKLFVEKSALFAPLVTLFRTLEFILDYEMNIPYEHWYGQREPFRGADLAKLITELGAANRPELTRFAYDLEQYAKSKLESA
jgi:hypothetical protein